MLFRLFSSLLLLAGLSTAAVPTISNISYTDLEHSSIFWRFTVSGPVYSQVKYGLSSGVYTYQSSATAVAAVKNTGTDPTTYKVAIAIGALKPDTTYYFRITAHPNKDDDVDICQDDSCGSFEQVVTTPPLPAIHPELPIPPKEYSPTHPDTSAYTIVPMTVGPTGECVAAQDVPSQNVTAGQTLPSILAEVQYGTVVEYPQGVTCKVPPQSAANGGYILPSKAVDPMAGGDIDSPNHRWIVLRTKTLSPADFPPFGTRTSPAWAGKMAKLEAQKQAFRAGQGQVFDTYSGSGTPHHFWFETLEITHATNSTLFPEDGVDPQAFNYLINLTAQHGAQSAYIVLDRNYIHGHTWPARTMYGVMVGGRNIALLSNWVSEIEFWRMAYFPTVAPTLSNGNATLNVPTSTYQIHAYDQPVGMTAPATVSVSAGATGRYIATLGTNGLQVDYTSADGTVTCDGCTAVYNPDLPAAGVTPYYNHYPYFWGNISGGQFTVAGSNIFEYSTTTQGVMSFGLLLSDNGTGPYKFDNNFLDGYGIGFYVDAAYSSPSNDDMVWKHGHQWWGHDHIWGHPSSNGLRYEVRQHWEIKRGRRYSITGSLFDGNWSFQNVGPSILLSVRAPYDLAAAETGITDVDIRSIVVRHSSYGVSCSGDGMFNSYSGGSTGRRVRLTNSLMYDINKFVYSDHYGPGITSSYVDSTPGCQDQSIRNNTFTTLLGLHPSIIFIGGSGTLGEGFEFKDNIAFAYKNTNGCCFSMNDNGQQNYSHPRIPLMNDTGTFRQGFDSFFVQVGASVTPNYKFENNVLVGATTGVGVLGGGAGTQTDIPYSTLISNSYLGTVMSGNFVPNADTFAGRLAQTGFTNPSVNNWRLLPSSPFRSGGANPASTGGTIGADFEQLVSDIGFVTWISVQPGSDSAVFRYTAPDGRACSVDVSPDGIAWTRTTDKGGPRARTLPVTGLSAGQEYQYRVLCYFTQPDVPDQMADDAAAFPGVMPTTGSFTTTASGAPTSVRIPATAPANRSIAKAAVDYGSSSSLGSTVVQDCPITCTFNVPATKGQALYWRLRWLTSGDITAAQGSVYNQIP